MPPRTDQYFSKTLHPFFDGLIPEGWLLSIVVKNWKLNVRERMVAAVQETWLSGDMQERLKGIIGKRMGMLGE